MLTRPKTLFLLFCALLVPLSLAAQYAPICDVICGPDPGSPTYSGGTIQARPLPRNGRGRSTVLAVPARGDYRPPNEDAAPWTLPGSESYSYAVPILSLPGRNGLDLNLTLYYNSRVWTIDGVNGTATFNADKDFPSYGFRLGFGFIEGTYTDSGGIAGYILTEPDASTASCGSTPPQAGMKVSTPPTWTSTLRL